MADNFSDTLKALKEAIGSNNSHSTTLSFPDQATKVISIIEYDITSAMKCDEETNTDKLVKLAEILRDTDNDANSAMDKVSNILKPSEVGIKVKEDDAKYINGYLSDILKRVILYPVDNNARIFVTNMMMLIHNWNQLAKSQRIADSIKTITNFLNFQESVVTTIEVLKSLTREVQRIQSFAPPAFTMSEHYLESLKASIEEFEGGVDNA